MTAASVWWISAPPFPAVAPWIRPTVASVRAGRTLVAGPDGWDGEPGRPMLLSEEEARHLVVARCADAPDGRSAVIQWRQIDPGVLEVLLVGKDGHPPPGWGAGPLAPPWFQPVLPEWMSVMEVMLS